MRSRWACSCAREFQQAGPSSITQAQQKPTIFGGVTREHIDNVYTVVYDRSELLSRPIALNQKSGNRLEADDAAAK